MSLDIDLVLDGRVVYSTNITHNLNEMAEAVGIYKHLWRPEEIAYTKAGELVKPLRQGLAELACYKSKYEKFNSANGWGVWINFVEWLAEYLDACRAYPEANILVSR